MQLNCRANKRSNSPNHGTYVYLFTMKARLNLSIETNLLAEVQNFAQIHEMPISELVEQFFKTIVVSSGKTTLVDKVESLNPPTIEANVDFKEQYFKEQGLKYGF